MTLSVLEPAREFVLAIGERLGELGPDLHAEPRVHGSILAINRDTRLSTDKTPYNTHVDLWFRHAAGPELTRERPGYFVRIQEQRLILGAGMHAFSVGAADGVLDRYRQVVLDPVRGAQLEAAAAELFSDRLPDLCLTHFQKYKPILQWLVDLLPA